MCAEICQEINDHFGTSQDLIDLSAALHARGMYLMVDVVSKPSLFSVELTGGKIR